VVEGELNEAEAASTQATRLPHLSTSASCKARQWPEPVVLAILNLITSFLPLFHQAIDPASSPHFIMSSRRSQRSAAVKAAEAITDAASDRVSRPRRTASENISMATVSRGPASAQSRSPQSMRLTVKTSSSKLREATRSSSAGNSVVVNSRDGFVGGEIIEGKRARNVRKSYVLESDSDEDEEMEDVGDEEDEDAEGESVVEDDEDMDAEDDGLGDEDAEGDIDMDVPPPPPVIKISKAQGRQTIAVKPPTKHVTQKVEQKEMEEASDDEELSELDSDIGEEVEEEEAMQTGNEEDAEGEEEEIEIEEDVDDDDDDLDSDDETPAGGSRASTPDLNKLTKRQRARLEEGGSGHLLALPDGKSPDLTYELD
jgi:Ino eighty subunit 2